jgi:hypothetical protein
LTLLSFDFESILCRPPIGFEEIQDIPTQSVAMPEPASKDGDEHPHAHIEIPAGHEDPKEEGQASPGMKNSRGWDGKLRVPKSALLSNPEALSDPEYSDDDNIMPGEQISADEGLLLAREAAHPVN